MTPDLVCVLRADGLDRSRAREIAEASRTASELRVDLESRLVSMEPTLTLPQVHDLLTDEADWEAPTWAMDPAGRERLAQTLEWLFGQIPGELTFEAVWDEAEDEKHVTRPELLTLVRAGEIGTRTRYRVSPGAR